MGKDIKITSGGGSYFKGLGKIEGQLLAGDKEAGFGPSKSGGPADPKDKPTKEKKVVRIYGSSGKVLAERKGASSTTDATSSNPTPQAIVGKDGIIINARNKDEIGMYYKDARKARSQEASKKAKI